MAKEPFLKAALDQEAYDQADKHFKAVASRLPQHAVEALAREVVRRLAFRMPRTLRKDHLPNAAEIEKLCRALLSGDELAGDRMILAVRRDGIPIDVIHLSYIAEAARHLGRLWDRDEVSFAQVTMATGRLYRILRGLRKTLFGDALPDGKTRAAVFALVPEETHTVGIEIASEMFRRANWDVDMLLGMDQDEISAALEQRPVQAVVLVAHTDREIASLLSLVVAVRVAQPFAYVVLAGNVVDQVEDAQTLIGADAVITDLAHAVEDLERIVGDG